MPPSPRESEVPYPTPLCLVILGMRLMVAVAWAGGSGAGAAKRVRPHSLPGMHSSRLASPPCAVLCGQGVTARIAVASAAELRQLLHERLDDVLAKCDARQHLTCCCGRIVMRGLNVRDGLGVPGRCVAPEKTSRQAVRANRTAVRLCLMDLNHS